VKRFVWILYGTSRSTHQIINALCALLVFRMREFVQYLEAILQPPNMNIDGQPSILAQYQGGNRDRMSSTTTKIS